MYEGSDLHTYIGSCANEMVAEMRQATGEWRLEQVGDGEERPTKITLL